MVPAQAGGRWAELGERGALWGMHCVNLAWRLLGRRACAMLLAPIVTWFWLTDPSRRRASLDWLRRAHAFAGLPPPRWWHGLQHWLGFAQKAMDSVAVLRSPNAVGPMLIEDPDDLHGLAASGQGGMILVSHLGNADMARAALSGRFSAAMTVLMHTRNAANYNRMLDKLHGDPNSRTLEVTQLDPATAIDLQQRLARGEWLAMAADRTPVSREGRQVRVPFLGAPAAFPVGPWVIAALLRCPVFVMFCLRRPEGGYHIRFERFAEVVTLPRSGRETAIADYAARYACILQAEATRAPMQWYNFYDFWA